MRFKLTILLVLLNLAVFSLILYVDRNQGSKDEFLEKSRLVVDPSFLQSVNDIEIDSPSSGQSWQLELSSQNNWQVIHPVHWKANPYAIQQLLFQLKTLSWLQRFPVDSLAAAGQSLQSYNLENPSLSVSLQNDAEKIVLNFGAPTEIGNRLYILSPEGDYILVISRELALTLQRNMESFLDRRIFGAGMEESRVIQIQDRTASNVRVRMERTGQKWEFVSPIEAAADSERVQAVLADWQTLEGRNFRMPTAEDNQVRGDGLRLTVEGLDLRESVNFSVETQGEGDSSYYLARMEGFDTVFEVSAPEVNALRGVQEDLREKRILSRHAEDWTSLEIRFDEMSTTLQRLENGSWQVLNKNEDGELISQPADQDVIGDVRKVLETLEVVRFVSDAPSATDIARYGLNNPQRRIILRKQDGRNIELDIGENEGSLLYGTTSETPSVFLIRPHILSTISLNPMYYRERTIRTVPESVELLSIRLKGLINDISTTISKTETPLAWANLQEYLRKVEVARYINRSFSDPLDLDDQSKVEWAYILEGTFKYPESIDEELTTHALYLSDRIGGTTQYIGDPDSGLVGLLPADLIEILEPLMVEFPEDPGAPSTGDNPQNPTGS